MIKYTIKFSLSLVLISFYLIGQCLNSSKIQPGNCGFWCQWGHHVALDYKHFYSTGNLLKLGGGFAVGAVVANTSLDQNWSNYYQRHWRSADTNSVSVQFKKLGAPMFALSYVGGYALGKLFHDQTITTWGERSMRALIVGLPPMWLMQKVTGAYRPSENKNSYWHFWNEDHGVSGHAFMGAIPFMTAASMSHNVVLKSAFYLGATFAGLSRINDNRHYPSQVLLGWWMAYLAVNSVHETDQKPVLSPMILPGGGGVVLSAIF